MISMATQCTGIGSAERAMLELGVPHEIVFACERDKFAKQTYLANFTPKHFYHDMTAELWDLPEQYADLIVAGIPCQSFSLAGKRKGENDPRGLLIYDFIRYVKNQRPKVFIIENVKGLLSDAGGVTFSKWCDLLGSSKNGSPAMFHNPDSCGYNLHYRVLNAKNYGLPQNRERIFIIGIRPDLKEQGFRWPKPVVLKDRLIDLLESEVDEKYYLSDTALQYITRDSGNWSDRLSMMDSSDAMVSGDSTANHSKGVPYNMLQVHKLPVMIKVCQLPGYEVNGRVYSEQGLAPNIRAKQSGLIHIKEATKQGYAIATNGDSISLKHPNSATRRGRVGKGIANTIDTTEDCVVDNYRIRRYTPLETMRLMGYPDSFVKPCSETQTYKQAGNSIPVHMMKAILRQLLPILTA